VCVYFIIHETSRTAGFKTGTLYAFVLTSTNWGSCTYLSDASELCSGEAWYEFLAASSAVLYRSFILSLSSCSRYRRKTFWRSQPLPSKFFPICHPSATASTIKQTAFQPLLCRHGAHFAAIICARHPA
jgi:hypothetical protein